MNPQVGPVYILLLSACGPPLLGYEIGYEALTIRKPDYEEDIAPIWTRSCRPCHVAGGAAGGLDLGLGSIGLVDVPAVGASGQFLVVPQDVGASYLWRKLDGSHLEIGGAGDIMPIGTSLDLATMTTIENWIAGLSSSDNPTWVDQIEPALKGTCGTCHSGSNAYGGFSLDGGYAGLLQATASFDSNQYLVVSGSPEESFLLLLIEGRGREAGGSVSVMPPGAEPNLTLASTVEAWILAGTPENVNDLEAPP
jgi:hypothetical protein